MYILYYYICTCIIYNIYVYIISFICFSCLLSVAILGLFNSQFIWTEPGDTPFYTVSLSFIIASNCLLWFHFKTGAHKGHRTTESNE